MCSLLFVFDLNHNIAKIPWFSVLINYIVTMDMNAIVVIFIFVNYILRAMDINE